MKRNYWLMQKTYIAPGEGSPNGLINASLEHPVKVRMEDTVMRGGVPEPRKVAPADRFLVLIDDEKPEASVPAKPVDVRPNPVGSERAPANLAQEVGGDAPHGGGRRKRAADM